MRMSKTYVDNSYNRSLGRVGMEHGSMVVSRGSSGGGSGSGGGGISGGGDSLRFGVSTPKTYVDNSYNRSLGRVGMEHGSMVVSRGSSGGGSGSGGGGISGGGDSLRFGVSTPKTYVDNSYNRSLGRVGMEHGSKVVSRGGSGSGSGSGGGGICSGGDSPRFGVSTPKTYVDNSYNRSLCRVGMEHGTMVVSRGSSGGASLGASGYSSFGAIPKTYVDNYQNRRLDRVGMEHGTMMVSKSSKESPSVKLYKDNSFNRRLGRVGKPIGTAVFSRKANSESGVVSTRVDLYVDSSLNRSRGRVGKPRGSEPCSRKSKLVRDAQKMIALIEGDMYDEDYERGLSDPIALEIAISNVNRKLEEMTWVQEQNENKTPKTKAEILEEYSGDVIQFEDIELGRKIGQGGFGDVYFARWKGSVVAVKKLRLQRVSIRRLKEFVDEIAIFCELDHPNIVEFLGACIKTPNLSIVMEYMPMSLFDALHMNMEIDFSDGERLQIIRQTCSGLEYLHEQGIAHCDLKSQNVLLDYVSGETCLAKLTDFGLSMIKANTETSVSGSEKLVRNVGTPRYSAPEVLRGERLSARDMMFADSYSLSLIIYEVICEEEPFYDFTYAQMRKQVGEKGAVPEFPVDIKIDSAVQRMIRLCWSFKPEKRPIVKYTNRFFKNQHKVYMQ
ncbi:hypothetical protein CHS0354_010924 [Potamilus streckersoni]|uniref:non-specific serine/threonine protein kinase n=1 Tax=Potamilus streckersoni TaxID=2493646 RepID=A0AAE0SS85_9BIVA|nr:hypothetical protein CHS0354_010924 [Potamilus streckersoni]